MSTRNRGGPIVALNHGWDANSEQFVGDGDQDSNDEPTAERGEWSLPGRARGSGVVAAPATEEHGEQEMEEGDKPDSDPEQQGVQKKTARGQEISVGEFPEGGFFQPKAGEDPPQPVGTRERSQGGFASADLRITFSAPRRMVQPAPPRTAEARPHSGLLT